MKIAIPIFGSRVSPRFDCAVHLLFLTLENGKIVSQEEISMIPWNPLQRIEKLKELQVQTLICGGIDGNSERMLQNYSIQVIPWIFGEITDALDAFLKGKLKPGFILYPRCGRMERRWQRRNMRQKTIRG